VVVSNKRAPPLSSSAETSLDNPAWSQ